MLRDCTTPLFEWKINGGKEGGRELSAGGLMYRRLREEKNESKRRRNGKNKERGIDGRERVKEDN